MTGTSVALRCRGVSLSYGATPVLDELDIDVAGGETVALLGPSGSGKTSLLGVVAGFVPVGAGEIHIDEVRMSQDVPPEERPVSMVFQNYALWPHMTAVQIVAYPLRRAGVPVSEARADALHLLDRVGIADLADRYPSELSGGQQQRVGLARALAKAPVLYLFDEPTAHLDAALRTVLQEELIDRQREAGAAALYATHDPLEALAVADRLALLRDGRVVQAGPPRVVYDEPVDAWAAHLTGPAEVLGVELLDRHQDVLTIRIGDLDVAVAGGGPHRSGRVDLVVRPEWAALGGRLPGIVHRTRFGGHRTTVLLDTEVGRVFVQAPSDAVVRPGDHVTWSLNRVWIAEASTVR